MKFKARFTVEQEVVLEADTVTDAAQYLRSHLTDGKFTLLGVIPPTLDAQPEPVQAVAA